MIVQLAWFAAGFATSAVYWNELKELFYQVEAKLTDTDIEDPGFRKTKSRDQVRSGAYLDKLVKESLQRAGLDSKEVNLNKALSQISQAISQAYDKYGEPGTVEFMKKWNAYKKTLSGGE